MNAHLHHGDCRTVLATMPDASIDAVVTDPPYELGFMGKRWDATGIAYDVIMWAEVLRVLKPGGHLLAFGGTRTYHRMACAIEDAGFEIRDSIHWLYGSGFPKSLDVSKAIDKVNGEPNRLHKFTAWMRTTGLTARRLDEITGTNMGGHYVTAKSQPAIPTAALWKVIRPHCGDVPAWVDELVARIEAEREVVGTASVPVGHAFAGETYGGNSSSHEVPVTAPATDAARQWEGWGTALKPAHEPIVVARKPLDGTVAANVLQHGTGAINVNGARVGSSGGWSYPNGAGGNTFHGQSRRTEPEVSTAGRWPANLVLSHSATCGDQCAPGCPIAAIDQQADGAARFFTHADLDPLADLPFAYVAKPSRSERNAGLDGVPPALGGLLAGGNDTRRGGAPQLTERHNYHPTVKPLALMRWLVRLVTPPDGTVLDPFAGSGTTLAAAILEERHAIGIELTADYLPIIHGRIAWAQQQADHDRNQPKQETLDL